MAYDEYMNKMAAMGALPTEPAIRSVGSGSTSDNESAAFDRAKKTYMDAMQNLMMQEQSGQMQGALPQPQPRPVGSGSTSDDEFEAYRRAVQGQPQQPQPRPVGSGC